MNGNRMVAWLEAAPGAALIALLALPPSRSWLEASLAGHVLAQIPLLAFGGWLIGGAFALRFDTIMVRWNRGGLAGLTLVIATVLFWMLPRSVDGAVQYTSYELLKFITIPFAGVALAVSLRRTPPLLAGALKANLISMLGVLAWLYTAAPARLCNSYLRADQEAVGAAMAFFAVALALGWSSNLFFGHSSENHQSGIGQKPGTT